MIVVEGSDGAGKSTLVKHLSEKFGMPVGQRGVANRDFLYKVTRQDTYRALSNAVRGDTPVEIWDRLWISEYVYHGIHPGRPCEFSSVETKWIRGLVDAIGCPFIVCLPPYEVVRENALGVHQMKGVESGLPDIYATYRDAPLPWPAHTMRYDYTGSLDYATLADVEEEIEGYLTDRKARQSWS